jgi:hypothetical protein
MLLGLLGSLSSACGERSVAGDRQPTTEPSTSTYKAQPGSASVASAPLPSGQDDDDLRRGYGIVDMRHDACVTADNESVLRGKACRSGYIIYGP